MTDQMRDALEAIVCGVLILAALPVGAILATLLS